MLKKNALLVLLASIAALSAYAETIHLRPSDLPEPFHSDSVNNAPIVIPKMNVDRLSMPDGFKVELWADGFRLPRQAYVAPNGDVLVVESGGGKVTLLRDADNDGKAEFRSEFLTGLQRPFGIDVHNGYLYIANTHNVVRLPYEPGQEKAEGYLEVVVPDIPTGGHWTRDVIFSPDGSKMYVSIGSRSNITEEPLPRAAVMEYNPDGSGGRVYASGLRNPVGLRFQPATGRLWTTVNERDGLGDDLPPDYVTSIQEGGFYGWPYAYIGQNADPRLDSKRMDLVEKTLVPDVLIQSHSAALGLLFYTGGMFPAEYEGELLVALHGSWNRARRTGYKIIRAHMNPDGTAVGSYEDFISGWSENPDAKEVWGRPVGLAQLLDGSLLILEDGGHKIWRVSYANPEEAEAPKEE